ncbi:MAG TPA: trigger factor [Gemmatales bacterium]|nr:trigger factor [Gemmatales bacterium]
MQDAALWRGLFVGVARMASEVLENPTTTTDKAEKPKPLTQEVTINDAGPCLKHVKVVVAANDISDRVQSKFKEMMPEVQTPGFRPGKAPRKLIEKQFYKDVTEQLKGELLLQSLEQLADDYKLNPISQPQIDPYKVDMPKDGALTYEFNVEVAPEFELPNYKGLKIKRPTKTFSDADIKDAQTKFLRRFASTEETEEPAKMDDIIVADVIVKDGDNQLSKFDDLQLRVDPTLAFKDGIAEEFGKNVVGAKAGDVRHAKISLSNALTDDNLRGKKVEGTFTIKSVNKVIMPELSEAFLNELDVENADGLKEKIKEALERQLQYEQRQQARSQVLEILAGSATWDLPIDLLRRQASKTLNRRVMEMRSAGFSEPEIRNQMALLQQDAMATTARGLKEYFVLQKISEVEDIDVEDDDINQEIETMAEASDESPRKVRARIDRENMMEALMTQVLERKTLDFVLSSAAYEDVPLDVKPSASVASIEGSASGFTEEVVPPMETGEEPKE